MKTRKLFLIATMTGGLLFSAGLATTAGSAAAKALSPQTNSEGGVSVKVTPRNISRDSASWDFEVMLNTHTGDLSQDLAKSSSLIDAQGKPHAPIAWEGDPPGGHHRKGILRFKPLTGSTQILELRISGVGGMEARVFRWKLR